MGVLGVVVIPAVEGGGKHSSFCSWTQLAKNTASTEKAIQFSFCAIVLSTREEEQIFSPLLSPPLLCSICIYFCFKNSSLVQGPNHGLIPKIKRHWRETLLASFLSRRRKRKGKKQEGKKNQGAVIVHLLSFSQQHLRYTRSDQIGKEREERRERSHSDQFEPKLPQNPIIPVVSIKRSSTRKRVIALWKNGESDCI